jgi:pimeloyl-ACP methyl ester carboxylesterase
MWTRLLFAFVGSFGIAVAPVLSVAAHQATPSPAALGLELPMSPDPARCQIAPRPVEDFAGLIGTPVAPTPAVFTEPTGTPADQGIVDAVTATIIEFAACQSAGDFLRVGALYTDAGLAEDFTWVDADALGFLAATPEPAAQDSWQVVHSVSQVEVLDDGRVGARVEFGKDARYGADYLIFAEQDRRYLIDHFVDELLVTAEGVPDGAALISIGDRSLAMECRGEGSPTVLLEAGRFPSVAWTNVLADVASFTRVCRYDRATTGSSDPAPVPRSGSDVVADLHALLEAAQVSGPYVLVGGSMGGLFVRLYAATYPDEVVGMVLSDATHEAEQAMLDALLSPEEQEIVRELDFEGGDPEGFWTVEGLDALFAEVREARNAKPLTPMPLVVLAAGLTEDLTAYGYPARMQAVWWPITEVLQADLATLVPGARLVVVEESGHLIHEDAPEAVVAAIRDVVGAVRDPSTWEAAPSMPAVGTPAP